MDHSVHIIMAEYNNKTAELNRAPIIIDRHKNDFHHYPDTNELNNNIKCNYSLKKYGDQRLFAEYMEDFENKDDKDDFKIKKRGTLIDTKK